MVYEKTNTYALQGKSLDSAQALVEDVLKGFAFLTKSAKLDETLAVITFLDEKKDKTLQKDNKIALYQEQDQVFVQLKGELTDSEVSTFWSTVDKRFLASETTIAGGLWEYEKELKKLEFLSGPNYNQVLNITVRLPDNRQKQVLERLKEIERDIIILKDDDVVLIPEERANLILNLVKLNRSNRKNKINDLIQYKKVGVSQSEKSDVLNQIIMSIKTKGYNINQTDAIEFLNNFQEQYNRLPAISEIESIAVGYIKMMQEETPTIKEKEREIVEEKDFTEEIEPVAPVKRKIEQPRDDELAKHTRELKEMETKAITTTEKLLEKVGKFKFLSDKEKTYYTNLINSVDIEFKEMIVKNLEFIQAQFESINDVPNFDSTQKASLRKNLVNMDQNEILSKINQFIGQFTAEEEESKKLGWNPERALRKLGFLTESNINIILNMVKTLPEDKQNQVIERLKTIETEFNDLENDGIPLSDWEKSQFRVELVKLTDKNRKERLIDLVKDKKEEMIKGKIEAEIPQLKFEDNEKLVKELLWLSKAEIDQRIQKVKENIQKSLAKKQELFQKSTAGGTCPECGWPVGSFSKKCPRCGRKLIDWLE